MNEFFATLIENMFRSAGGSSRLRTSHGHEDLDRTDITASDVIYDLTGSSDYSRQFARDNRERIQTIVHRERELVYRLAAVRCGFNPFRDLHISTF